MDKQRVNKITAVYNTEDGVTITLYKTHTKLATVTNKDISVPDFKDSGTVNKPAYMVYCKETLMNLLENGGIEGFYYDPKNESEQSKTGVPKKFDDNSFAQWAKQIVNDVINGMALDDIPIAVSDRDMEIQVTERYKDGYIKYGNTSVPVAIGIIGADVPVEIRSGQLSKPKKININGESKGLNPTTIKSLVKSDKNNEIRSGESTKGDEVNETNVNNDKTTGNNLDNSSINQMNTEGNKVDETTTTTGDTKVEGTTKVNEENSKKKPRKRTKKSDTTESTINEGRGKSTKELAKDDPAVNYVKDMTASTPVPKNNNAISRLMDTIRENK